MHRKARQTTCQISPRFGRISSSALQNIVDEFDHVPVERLGIPLTVKILLITVQSTAQPRAHLDVAQWRDIMPICSTRFKIHWFLDAD